MSDTQESYEVTKLNRVGRMPQRASYDHHLVHSIFRACPIVHVGFIDEQGFPACVPMIAALEDNEDGIFVYLHGYGSSRFVKTNSEFGTRLVVTATLIDGFVLSLTPFHHSMNYRCAILHGFSEPFPDYATPEGKAAKNKAMEIVTDDVVPGRWAKSRTPTEAEVTSTGIIRMRVESGSAKRREGGPKEDKKDLDDPTLSKTTWSGHVPLRYVASDAIPADACNAADFPNGPTDEVAALVKQYQ